MSEQHTGLSQKFRSFEGSGILAGIGIVLLFFAGTGFLSHINLKTIINDSGHVRHTHEVLTGLEEIISLVKDAETGQRGYLITGDDDYLEPYVTATRGIDRKITDVEYLSRNNPERLAQIKSVKDLVQKKLNEMQQTIAIRRTEGFEPALRLIKSDRGMNRMMQLRALIDTLQDKEQQLRDSYLLDANNAYSTAMISGFLATGLGMLLSLVVARLMYRGMKLRRRQEWLQTGQLGVTTAMFGDPSVEQIGENALKFLAGYVGAHAGAFFAKDGDSYRRIATYGVPSDSRIPAHFGPNDGLLGQAVKERRAFIVRDVPEGYLAIGSALGQGIPRQLMISPVESEGQINAVLELGFLQNIDDMAVTLLDQASETLSVAIRSANYRENLQNFLEETQRQAEELQAQSEELRVSNEELEEQSRILRESQSRLEQQQAELEQTNTQLEEQAQQMESQRDNLIRTKEAVEIKAKELAQASRYKSDFLANMSHELRTPLNSSLILAKLLADNPDGNLTAEQVKYAQTIQTSGNDLLMLINDVLDLSKIEAGHMDIQIEPVSLARVLNSLRHTFEPIAAQKGIAFKLEMAEGCPETIDTDRQRLEQILKNLLSNAFKFTDRGSVNLKLDCAVEGPVSFAVTDTGIGISAEQQQTIFDAFRQADGTISRKYGGTGLGLSISRELTSLLGGAIHLESQPGRGSTFTLSLPRKYSRAQTNKGRKAATTASAPEGEAYKPPAPATVTYERTYHLEDDRENLSDKNRILLMVEDDERFARILCDLAHEMNFQCIIATSAEEALALSKQYMPSAVILDVGLPDHSGLSVLDRLKQDARTRHIPVHVVSASDHTEKAMSMGAIGYMLKPVGREELAEAFQSLETRLAHRVRRVLVVEDDETQRDSICKLLATANIETVGAGTAAECLALLEKETFDSMILDLSLPDSSGYTLLETLSEQDSYSFPPVIVYTGRELSKEDEQQLRRYSKSIIIKGAKSPERLLDEVTLFLHHVMAELPPAQQKMIEKARSRDAALEGRRILVVEDDIRNVYALTNILEPAGAIVEIARNGREALEMVQAGHGNPGKSIDLVLMDVMMPEVDGLAATREIRKKPEFKKLPIIMLTAKAMKDDQERCLEAGANDYMAKPIDVEKLLSLVRVWMPR